jgi:hypothetical protein
MAESNESEAILFFKSSRDSKFTNGVDDSRFPEAETLYYGYHELAFRKMGFDWRCRDVNIGGRSVRLMHVAGSCVSATLPNETGYSIDCQTDGKLRLDETGFLTVDDPDFQMLKDAIMSIDSQVRSFSCEAIESDKPHKVLRFWGNTSFDFRTGQTSTRSSQGERLLRLIQSGLPLPHEFNQKGN